MRENIATRELSESELDGVAGGQISASINAPGLGNGSVNLVDLGDVLNSVATSGPVAGVVGQLGAGFNQLTSALPLNAGL